MIVHASFGAVTSSSVTDQLLARLAEPKRAEISTGSLEVTLAQQLAAARAAWPTVQLDDARYLDQLAHAIAARATESADRVLRTMPAADLYLALACRSGDAAALAAFREHLLPTVRSALGKLGVPPATIDETEQRVLVMLFVGPTAQIGQYSGRGRLRSWVRSIAVRTARRMLGVAANDVAAAASDLPDAVRDPELDLLRARYANEVRAALKRAFGELDDRARNVLRQYHIDGLTIDQLATLYRVHRATAARWVASSRLTIVARTRELLAAELRLAPSEADSVIRLVRSELSISLGELA
jgi:RNA polymerase sigma-70 factor (ECF subfamily)